jgi:V/A-type H+-transporting ATPase subunit E
VNNVDYISITITNNLSNKEGITNMAQQIQDLVDSIQKQGVDKANEKAAKIISEANNKAKEIIRDAKKDASKMLSDAEKEIALRDQSAQASLKQASRDVQISLKKALTSQLDSLLVKKSGEAFTGDNLVKLIKSVLALDLTDVKTTELQVSEAEFKALGEELAKDLGSELKKGLEIKPVKDVNVGFRLAEKDGSGYFDFSDEATAKLMKPFLSSAIAEIVFNK